MAMQVSQFTLEFTYTKTNFIRIEKCRPVFLYYRNTCIGQFDCSVHILWGPCLPNHAIVFPQFGLSPTWENSALARTPLAAGYSDAFWTWWHGKTSWWMMMGLLSYMKFSSGNILLSSFKCLRFLRKIMWKWQVWAKAEISFWKQQYLKTKVPY